ncbi:putative transposase DNA-binding domain protein [archaeon]|nr:putative transposase DNA-binding domain protein [archaeon]
MKLKLEYLFRNDFKKINQIKINKEYAFISVSLPEPELYETEGYIKVDLNTTGHCAVVGNPKTGKVLKMDKMAYHIHKKYKSISRYLQTKGKYRKVKQIRNREQRIVSDMNHKISRKIVDMAKDSKSGLKMEDLKGIHNAKSTKSFRYSVNSWSFYQLRQMIEYKAKLLGVHIVYVDPQYTSGVFKMWTDRRHNRNGKVFKCPHCGHVDHAA